MVRYPRALSEISTMEGRLQLFYKKAGVIVWGISRDNAIQTSRR